PEAGTSVAVNVNGRRRTSRPPPPPFAPAAEETPATSNAATASTNIRRMGASQGEPKGSFDATWWGSCSGPDPPGPRESAHAGHPAAVRGAGGRRSRQHPRGARRADGERGRARAGLAHVRA